MAIKVAFDEAVGDDLRGLGGEPHRFKDAGRPFAPDQSAFAFSTFLSMQLDGERKSVGDCRTAVA